MLSLVLSFLYRDYVVEWRLIPERAERKSYVVSKNEESSSSWFFSSLFERLLRNSHSWKMFPTKTSYPSHATSFYQHHDRDDILLAGVLKDLQTLTLTQSSPQTTHIANHHRASGYLTDDEVILISLSTYSPTSFALKLIREIFTGDELNHSTIAGGRKYGQLDPRRIAWVGEAILKHKPFPEVYSHRAWRRIKNAIDRSLRTCIQKKKRREKKRREKQKKKKSFESESRQITSTHQSGIRKATKSWSTWSVLSKSRILRCRQRKEIFERRSNEKPTPEAIKI